MILFGSYATGKANADSDVDLLVIMPHKGRSLDRAVEIRLKVHPGFPIDIIVRSPTVVRKRIAMGDLFLKEIIETGKLLYEARNS